MAENPSSSSPSSTSSSSFKSHSPSMEKSPKKVSLLSNKEEFLTSLYNLIENNYPLLCETEKDSKFDIVELTLLLRSLGFRLNSLEFCEPSKEEMEMNEITVQFQCNKTGLLSKLSMKRNECYCPLKTAVNSFWEIQGVEPSNLDNVKTEVYQDTSCSLLPDVTKNANSFSKSVIMLALNIFRNESQLTRNFYEEKRSLSQTPEKNKKISDQEEGCNENNLEANGNNSENVQTNNNDSAEIAEKSNDATMNKTTENENQQNLSSFKINSDTHINTPKGSLAIENLQQARYLLDVVMNYLKHHRSPPTSTSDKSDTKQTEKALNGSFVEETNNVPGAEIALSQQPSDLLPSTSEQYTNGTKNQDDGLFENGVEELVRRTDTVEECEDEQIENNFRDAYQPGPIKQFDAKPFKKFGPRKSDKTGSKPMPARPIIKKVILPKGSVNYKNWMSPGNIDKVHSNVYRAKVKQDPSSSNAPFQIPLGFKSKKFQTPKIAITPPAGSSAKFSSSKGFKK